MARLASIEDLGDLNGRRVLLRADLNVPVDAQGHVADDTRIRAVIPTIHALRRAGAKVLILSHFGRPKGQIVKEMSLAFLIEPLSQFVGEPVAFFADYLADDAADEIAAIEEQIVLLENTRFHPGEEANAPDFARALAKIGDCFVSDAFSAAHRVHASTVGVAQLLPSAAGLSLIAEVKALEKALGHPDRPLAAIVGGAKISTKITVLEHLLSKVDHLIIGGAMANTFLAAEGQCVGKSLIESDMLDIARKIAAAADDAGVDMHLPTDVMVADRLAPGVDARLVALDSIGDDDIILDVGPSTVTQINAAIAQSKTLIWNGPLGAFETPPFEQATVAVAKDVAELCKAGRLTAVAGGGDTVAALKLAGVEDALTHVSTAGGAFLEWMEGKTLPGVAVLMRNDDVAGQAIGKS